MKKFKLFKALMLMVSIMLISPQVWGQTFNTTSPGSNSITTNNITVSSSNKIQSKTFNGTASTAVWKIDSKPTSITSTTANIYKIVFTACNNSTTNNVQSCCVTVSTDGSTYATLSSGVTVSGATGTTSTSTDNIYANGYNSYSTITVTFNSTLYRYVRIEKDGKETWVNSIKVYTAPTALTKGVATETTCPMTVTDGGNTVNYEFFYNTASTAPTSGSTATATFTSKTPTLTSLSDGTTYYCWVRSKYSNTEKSPWKALTGSTFTTVEAAPSCTAPDHVDISGTWDRFAGETISLTATAYDDGDDEIDDGDITGWQWQKYNGSSWDNVTNGTAAGVTISGATTKNLQISNCGGGNSGSYRCTVSTGATCSTSSEGYQVKVYTLECYTYGTTVYNFTRDGNNQRGSVDVELAARAAGHEFKIHADNNYYGATGDIYEDEDNWVFTTSGNNVNVHPGLGGTFTFTIDYSTNGDQPVLEVMYPRKRIYLSPGVWDADGAKFAYYYFRDGGSTAWTDFLTEDDCGMYADIPQWNGVILIPARLKNTTVSPGSWDDRWNQTNNITVNSNDYVTITGWDGGDGKSTYTYGTYSTPTYTISYNKGTSGSGTKSDETKTCGIAFTLPSSAVFTRTGYTQTGWTTSDGGAQEYALGGTYTTNEDKTFYPVWTVNNYDLTWNLGGGTTTSAGTGIASGVSVNTTSSVAYGASLTAPTVTKANYDFSAWSPSVASTMPAAATTYTATWTAKKYNVTTSLTDMTVSSGTTGDNAATYGTNYSLTLAADDGYVLPASITVTIGGDAAPGGSYSYNSSTGAVTITGSYITGNIVITAAGAEDVYRVTYAGNGNTGGTVPTDETAYDPEDEVTVASGVPTKSGSTFVGWLNSTNNTIYRADQTFTITDNTTLTAQWSTPTVTTYYYGGVSISAGALVQGTTSSVQFFTYANSTFANSTAITLSSTPSTTGIYSNTNSVSNWLTTSNWTTSSSSNRYIQGVDFVKDGSYTLALGSKVATSIRFIGFSNQSGTRTMTVGGVEYSTSSPSTIYSHEYTKSGNFTGNVTITQDGSFRGILIITVSTPTGYNVTFQNGSVSPASVSGMPANYSGVPSGKKIAAPTTDPTAANYIFGGWYTTSACSTPFDFANTTITTDKTIYAKWTAKTSPGSGTVSGTTSICSGSNTNVTLSTSVSGASYQLYKDNVASGDPKPGTGSALTWSVSAAGTYTVKAVETATHASGNMSGSATISIYTALSKTTDPTSSQNATVGVGCALSGLTYAGNANVAFKWQTCKSDGTDASDITSGSQYSNYTTATMTFTPAAAGTYYFRCVVSDDCGSSFNTSVVTVTAKVAPTVYTVSGTTSICSGDDATLTLSGSDDGVSYQLYKNDVAEGDPKAGTGSAISWTGIDAAGTYTVKTVETSTYAEATMTGSVSISIMTPTSISTQPTTSVTGHDGVNFTLGSNLVGAGEGTLTYQWYSYTSSGGAGEATVGSATTTKTLTTSKSAGTYYYKVEVIGECGSVKSSMITVTVDNKHQFSYNVNGGSSAAPSGGWYTPSTSITLSSAIPTHATTTKVFLGWNTNSTGSGTMYQPGATYTMPATATTLYAIWANADMYIENARKKGSWTDDKKVVGTTLVGETDIVGAIVGGSVTVTGSSDLQANAKSGLIFKNNTNEVTVVLTDKMLQEGSVITIGAVSKKSENGKTFGLAFNGENATPTHTNASTDSVNFKQRYVVTSSDALNGTASFIITMPSDFTGGQVYLKSIYVANCFSCTSITPSISLNRTTIYAHGGTPRIAKATLSGNTGNADFTWSSSNEEVLTIDTDGNITAVGAGTATVSAIIETKIVGLTTYCGAIATSSTITVPALVTQPIRVGKSTSWNGDGSAAPDMTFNDPTSSTSQVAVIANSGYTFDATATSDKDNMTGKFTGTETTKGSKYVTLKFKNATHNLRLGEVIARIQPVTNDGKAQVEIYEGSTLKLTSSEVTDITQGQLNDVRFTFASPYVFAANTNIEVRLYFYGQTNGFRLGTPFYVNGGVLVDQRFTDANSTGVWSDPANWDGGALPEIYHDVILQKPCSVDIAHATAKSVVIYNNSSDKTGKLTVGPNKGLEVAETVQKTTDGSSKTKTGEADLVLESSSAGNASLIFDNSNGCEATVMMYSKASINRGTNTWNWQYVGTPFTGSIPLYNYYGSWMYKWYNGNWAVVSGSHVLDPFVGYCLTQESATTHVMGGTLVPTTSSGEISIAGDMVLANSWTAPISICSFTESTFTSSPKTIYLFNTGSATEGSEEGEAAGTYITVPINSAKYTENYMIAPMQGFFVTTNDGTAGKITMKYNELVRTTANHTDIVAGPMKSPTRERVDYGEPDVMKIRVNGSTYMDRVIILAREDFSEGFDNGWDGEKKGYNSIAPAVFVINEEGKNDAVSAIPEYEGTLVGFRAGSEDNVYTMTFEYNGDEVLYLNDLKAQMSAEIANGQTYMFTTEDGDSEVRFIISHNPIRRITTGVDDVETGTKARKVLINEKIYIIRKGRVYSVDGQIVK